jgi:hypothetical protein
MPATCDDNAIGGIIKLIRRDVYDYVSVFEPEVRAALAVGVARIDETPSIRDVGNWYDVEFIYEVSSQQQ